MNTVLCFRIYYQERNVRRTSGPGTLAGDEPERYPSFDIWRSSARHFSAGEIEHLSQGIIVGKAGLVLGDLAPAFSIAAVAKLFVPATVIRKLGNIF